MKKKSNGVYNDRGSLTKCEPYSDLFDTIRAPLSTHHPKHRVQPLPLTEIPETLQQKLRREAWDRFKANNFMLPGFKFLMLIKLFKYLFLALALPLYFLVLTFPRWLIKSAFPKVTGSLKRYTEKISIILAKIFRGLIAKLFSFRWSGKRFKVELQSQKFGDLIKELKQIISNIGTNIWRKATGTLKKIFMYPINLVAAVIAKLKLLLNAVQTLLRKVQKKIIGRYLAVVSFFQKMKAGALKVVKWMKWCLYKLVSPIIHWLYPKILFVVNVLNAIASWLVRKLDKGAEYVRGKISPPAIYIVRKLRRFVSWLHSKMAPKIHSFVAWRNTSSKKIKNLLSIAKFYAKKPGREFVPMVKKVSSLMSKGFMKTVRAMRSGFKETGHAFLELLRSIILLMPNWINGWLLPLMEFIAQAVIAIGSLLKNSFIALLQKIKRFMLAIIALAAKTTLIFTLANHVVGFVVKHIKAWLAKLFSPVYKIASISKKSAGFINLKLKVAMVWSGILLQHGMSLVRKTLG